MITSVAQTVLASFFPGVRSTAPSCRRAAGRRPARGRPRLRAPAGRPSVLAVMGAPEIEVRQPGRRPLRLVLTEGLDVGRECDGLLLVDPGSPAATPGSPARRRGDRGPRQHQRDHGRGRAVSGPTPLPPGVQALVGGTGSCRRRRRAPPAAAPSGCRPAGDRRRARPWGEHPRDTGGPDPANSAIVQLAGPGPGRPPGCGARRRRQRHHHDRLQRHRVVDRARHGHG